MQSPPLLPREQARRLAQGVAQQIIGVFDLPRALQRATTQRGPQLARAEGATGAWGSMATARER